MSTPNLNLDHVTENQRNKAAAVNTIADGLDNAMNTILTLVSTGEVVLTDAQFRGNALFYLTGTPGAEFALKIPTGIERAFTVANDSNAAVSVEMEDATSDGTLVDPGGTAMFHSNGTSLFSLASGGTGGSGTTSTTIVQETGDFELTTTRFGGSVIIEVNSASPVSAFLEAGTTGTEPVTIIQTGLGQVTVIDASGVALNSADGAISTRAQWSAMSVIPRGSDSYVLVGDLE